MNESMEITLPPDDGGQTKETAPETRPGDLFLGIPLESAEKLLGSVRHKGQSIESESPYCDLEAQRGTLRVQLLAAPWHGMALFHVYRGATGQGVVFFTEEEVGIEADALDALDPLLPNDAKLIFGERVGRGTSTGSAR